MNLPWLERIGVRFGLAVAGVLLLLASVTNVQTNLAFERSALTVQEASAQELERLTHSTLLEITEREAQVISSALERSAAASRTAAHYLAWHMAGSPDPAPALALVELESGHWHDPTPGLQTAFHVPRGNASSVSANRDAAASRVIDNLLPSLAPELEDGVGIYYASPDGVVRYHPAIDFPSLIDPEFDVTVQPVYRLGTPEANPERLTRWTAPYPDDVGNGLLVTVLTPVYANEGFRGVVNVDVSLTRLATRLAQVSPMPESLALLIDGQGRLITASPGAPARLGYARNLAFGTPLAGPELDGLLTQVAHGLSGITTLGESEDAVVLAHAPVQGTDWALAIGVPRNAVEAPARQIAAGIGAEGRRAQRGTALVSLAAFVLALGILVIATREWVGRPIAGLTAGTRRLGAGELGIVLPLRSQGEFRVLGEAFNRMSHTLAHQRDETLEHQGNLRRQVVERTRQLGNLVAITADMSAATDPPTLMSTVLERLREAVPFASGGVWLIEGEALLPLATVQTEGSPAPATVSTGVLDEFRERLTRRQPVVLPSVASDDPLRGVSGGDATSLLLLPLTQRERLSGVLVLNDPVISETHQVDLVAAVAQQLGTALENARLLLEARERSALEERQHLARELHDSVSQALFGIVLGLQTAQKELDGPGRLRTSVEYALELADAALKEMRALIFELRPESLEAEGLTGLLNRQAEMLRARHDIEVELSAAEPPLPVEAKAVLYRVAQEALHNVVKHAQATNVQVTLEERDGTILLEVRDDGRGFAVADSDPESFGLHSMRQRMTLLGGHLEVSSDKHAGTHVTATLPLPQIVVREGAATA